MKNYKDKEHHNDVTTTHDSPMNRYFGNNNDTKKSSCGTQECHCKCSTCNKSNDCDKKCDCNCNDCHCNGKPEGHCCS